MRVSTALLGLLSLLAVAPLHSAEQVLRLDPAASTVAFTLSGTLHTVHGELPLLRGEIRFDLASGVASGEVVLDAAAAATGNAKRDRKMHSEVLRSRQFPRIVFVPRSIQGELRAAGTSQLTVGGSVTLCGVEHQISWTAEVEIEDGQAKGSATFSVPYVAWGLEDPSVFVFRVAKQVEVELAVVGELAP